MRGPDPLGPGRGWRRWFPEDSELRIFHTLALATAVPTDKSHTNQLKAAQILQEIFVEHPNHPGVAHYLIHSYDYPLLAKRGSTLRSATPTSRRPHRTPCTCPPNL
jgi:hypothetical protein